MRGAKGGGMDQIERIISKNTTQTKNKVRNVAYSEDLVRSNIQTLYDTILKRRWNMIPPQLRGRQHRIHGRQPASSTGREA